VAGAVFFAARTCGSAVDRYLAPLLAVVVTAAGEVTESYGQRGIDNPARLLDLGD
jgi:hypothetical protein